MRLLALAADNSEPDRRQAVKTGAIAPPLRGFGLDCLDADPVVAYQADKDVLRALSHSHHGY